MAHGGGGREDCWSEGGTGALVEAWGDRYLQLSRGNLRQKDWKEVAEAVNERQETVGKPRKTDIQCKNRIDTLKKKYKLEKSKAGPSQWPFFSRLDLLVGPNSAPAVKKPLPPSAVPFVKPQQRHPSLTFNVKPRNPNPNPGAAVYSGGSSSRSRINSHGSSESSRGDNDDDDEGEEDGEEEEEGEKDGNKRLVDGVGSGKRRWEGLVDCGGGGGGDSAFGELARAIVKFAEVYERVESSKQQQMMELERQRMEFAKDLEFQRMQMFMEAQLELEKMKRPKYSSGSGKRL